MSDLIKREDAIKAIEELPNAYNGWSDAYDKAYIIGTLEEVPSADRPQGEWIDSDGNFVPLDKDGCTTASAWCSNCGEWLTGSDEYWTSGRFCPNCGARMKGADDE